MMRLSILTKQTANVTRVAEIITILSRYGLAHWLHFIELTEVKQFFTGPDGRAIADLSDSARFRMALTELGPTFIKLGQILSTRQDLIGPEWADELANLQSNTIADSPEDVCLTITEQLGAHPAKLFAEFEAKAFASASIGQVHHAKLANGTSVVVKVQHRGIEDKIHRDLDILLALAQLAEKSSSELRRYRPMSTITEFRRALLRELDFRRELRNIQEFGAHFRDDDTVGFPVPYPHLSSQRVLTMEYLHGIGVGHLSRRHEKTGSAGSLAIGRH